MRKSVSSWSTKYRGRTMFPFLLAAQDTMKHMGLKNSIIGDKAKSKR